MTHPRRPARRDRPTSPTPLDLTTWLEPFRASDAFARVSAAADRELDGLVRVIAGALRWTTDGQEAPDIAEALTADAAVELLTRRIPERVTAADPDALIEAAVRLLEWAAKSGRVPDRRVETAVRRVAADARAAMASPRRCSPGKEMAVRALRDGVELAELDRLREHAIATGLSPAFVDEFLPPPPVSLGDGRWLYLPPGPSDRP